MKMIAMKLAALAAVTMATGCIKDYAYEGDYEMTYDVVMRTAGPMPHAEVRAGLAAVELRPAQIDEHLIDLGASFCLLTGTKVQTNNNPYLWPHLEIPPQACWFSYAETTYALTLGGTATYDEDSDRMTIVLAGSYADDAAKTRGSATIELTESW